MENKLQLSHYKETDPESTVKRISQILSTLHIELDETHQTRDFDCHSVRVVIKGTNIGTNGKGVSLAYARASAYAEFMERLENHILHNSMLCAKENYWSYPEDRTLSWEMLVTENNSFIRAFLEGCGKGLADSVEKTSFLSAISQCSETLCRSYFSLKEKRMVYVPADLFHAFYASSGMCAGNKPEEALSQGISEIVERYVMYRLFVDHRTLPDIPTETIEAYPWVNKIFRTLQDMDGYNCRMKDCSLDGKYPVAAFLMIEKDTGHYGLKFGSHPDMGIAMERAMTEAFQGRTEKQFAKISSIYFRNRYIENFVNIFNSYKTSAACYPPELFLRPTEMPFVSVPSVSGKSNKNILKEQLNNILEQGHDILIKDVSYLGFPAYSIIVPGMSESLKPNILMMKACNSRKKTVALFSRPSELSPKDIGQMLLTMEFYKSSILENSLPSFYCVPIENYPFIGNEEGMGIYFLLSMLYFVSGDYEKAFDRMDLWLAGEKQLKVYDINPLYRCIYKYMESRAEGNSHEMSIDILGEFFRPEIICTVDGYFKDPATLLGKLYPSKKCSGAGEDASDELCKICDLQKYCKLHIIKNIWESCRDEMENSNLNDCEIREVISAIFNE